MRYLLRFAFCVATATLLVSTLAASPINVTQGKPVTLNGTFGVLRAGSTWAPGGPLGAASVINDGVFFPENTQWDLGSIWWDATLRESANNSIEIDLQGAFHIEGIITQADDNDRYRIDFLDPHTNTWLMLGYWDAANSWGLVTRPNADQTTIYPISFDASKIRLTAFDGDGYYSYGEFQAFGQQVPEPGTWVLMGAGLAGLALLRRRR